MEFLDPHIHMYSRTTDDYQNMALCGIRAVIEPSFWLGQERTSAKTLEDYWEYLITFERKIADLWEAGKIRGPIHLSGGNEKELIEIFQKVKSGDWVFSTWRSHYHALLKGIDPSWLEKEILDGKSITIVNKEHKFYLNS